MLAGRVQRPCAPARPRPFQESVSGPPGSALNAISTPRGAGSPVGRQVWGCRWRFPVLPGRSISSGWPPRPGPASATYLLGGGAGSADRGEVTRAHAFLGAVASGAGRGGAHPPGWEEGGDWGRVDRVPRRSQGRRQERRGALLRGPQVPDLPRAATAGMLEASPRCLQRRPTVRAPAALRAEGGELRWRDARPAPASSSARLGARAVLVC